MDIKSKLLVSKFKNNSYCKDLQEYIYDMVNENKLDYNKLKYIYDNLYKGYSDFIKQNIYPVSKFLSNGYSFEECEKIIDLLDDATGKTVFCYEKKEQGYRFNKIYLDLDFSFDKYDELIKKGSNKDVALKMIKYELDLTPTTLKYIIYELKSNICIYHSDIKNHYQYINDEIRKLKNKFQKSAIENKFQSIKRAEAIMAGIDLRNLQRENNNLGGEKEKYPYSDEQIKMIDLYEKLEDTKERLEQYVELNYDSNMLSKLKKVNLLERS